MVCPASVFLRVTRFLTTCLHLPLFSTCGVVCGCSGSIQSGKFAFNLRWSGYLHSRWMVCSAASVFFLRVTGARQTSNLLEWLPAQIYFLIRPLDVYRMVGIGWMVTICSVPEPAVGLCLLAGTSSVFQPDRLPACICRPKVSTFAQRKHRPCTAMPALLLN
jgi:hypothetical protein